ncbi:MAG: hypothetical protein LBB56_06480 [Chitinispirillales bacterium]|jgi:hypothetical protein|nr:hypothetical protein [Chitinispirillales bacterium]
MIICQSCRKSYKVYHQHAGVEFYDEEYISVKCHSGKNNKDIAQCNEYISYNNEAVEVKAEPVAAAASGMSGNLSQEEIDKLING